MSLKHAIAALAAATSVSAAAGEYTDLWWNPQESGWGANIVQQGETAFVTLFVYGPDGKPTWYVVPAAQVFAYDHGGHPAFRGTLYRTQGPWQGGPFDASKVQVQPAGTMTIEPAAGGGIRLFYEAEGLSITKDLVRQTFDAPYLGTTYHGSFRLRQAAPGQAPWGTRDYTGDVMVHVEAGQAFLRVDEGTGRCDYRGSYAQSGKFARMAGEYECSDGTHGTFEVADFEVTRHGITGYLRTWSPMLNQYGRFGAARF